MYSATHLTELDACRIAHWRFTVAEYRQLPPGDTLNSFHFKPINMQNTSLLPTSCEPTTPKMMIFFEMIRRKQQCVIFHAFIVIACRNSKIQSFNSSLHCYVGKFMTPDEFIEIFAEQTHRTRKI